MKPQTHKNPRDLTQRVLLLANLVIFFAVTFRLLTRNGNYSIDLDDMKAALLLYPKTARIQTIAPCYQSALSVVHSQKNG